MNPSHLCVFPDERYKWIEDNIKEGLKASIEHKKTKKMVQIKKDEVGLYFMFNGIRKNVVSEYMKKTIDVGLKMARDFADKHQSTI